MQLENYNIIDVESPLLYLCDSLFDYGPSDHVVVTVQVSTVQELDGLGEGVASKDMMKIRYEMVYMFGAAMAGSKVVK